MLGSLILYLKGHEDYDVPTLWLLLYRPFDETLEGTVTAPLSQASSGSLQSGHPPEHFLNFLWAVAGRL